MTPSSATTTPLSLFDTSAEVDELWDELQAAMHRVLRSGRFILGPEVQAFEEEVADLLGVQHAIGVNSGTDALVIGLRALGIEPGDEVITTPFTFFATAESISLVGATPVFVDIDPHTFNLDPACVEAAITPRTRAIIPVHLFGATTAMGRLLDIAAQHDLKVLEDTAQAFGATYEVACPGCEGAQCPSALVHPLKGKMVGTLGDLGAYSFFPTKNLGAYGDGGLVTTDDDDMAGVVRMLRKHGAYKKYHNEALGYNSRLDALQAAILRVKLPHLTRWNEQRRAIAARYNTLLEAVEGVVTPSLMPGHVFHQYTIRLTHADRDAVQDALRERGIQTMVYYPVPCHQLPVYDHLDVHLPHAEAAARQVLSLPMWPYLKPEQQERVATTMAEVLRDA